MMLFRLLIVSICLLLGVYYLEVILHCLGLVKIADSVDRFDAKMLIPFYYYFNK